MTGVLQESDDGGVTIRGFSRSFGATSILKDLDLDLAPGEFVAMLGRSGSGKTTLLRTLARLDPVTHGYVRLPKARAVVFQEPRLLPWKQVWRNVTVGLRDKARKARAIATLHEVGLGHRVDVWPATLSGGEAQRAALARALVREPALLLLDEPFASLDALTRIRMHQLVSALWAAHRPGVLLVTHDVDEALLLADRVVVLADGKIRTDIRIEVDRPRVHAAATFGKYRAQLLEALRVEDGADNSVQFADHAAHAANKRATRAT